MLPGGDVRGIYLEPRRFFGMPSATILKVGKPQSLNIGRTTKRPYHHILQEGRLGSFHWIENRE